jgi:hypothetical protein
MTRALDPAAVTTDRIAPPRPNGDRRRRRLPPTTLLVAIVVAFNAWTLRAEALPARPLNDASFHVSYLGWAADRIAGGHLPFDGLFTQLGLGFPIFHHYQVLPHLLLAPVAAVVGAATTVSVSTFLLLALWPLCIYASARLFGFDRWIAAAAAAVCPFVVSVPGYGYEAGSYVWRGYGMWTQLVGMWLLPLGLALSWRAIVRGRSLALAALVGGLALTSHWITGYLLLLAVGLWVVVVPRPFWRHAGRAALVVAGAAATSAWLLVPAFLDVGWTRMGLPPDTFWRDSYGASQVVRWLAGGSLFDEGRLPVLTVLVASGVVVSVRRWRRDPACRAVLSFWLLSLVLYFGRSTVGPVVDLLPGHDALFLHRMIIGVHLGGVLLAGIGLTALLRGVVALGRKLTGRTPRMAWAFLVVPVVIVLLAPAWRQAVDYHDEGGVWIAEQRAADGGTDPRDFSTLVEAAKQRGGGRIYAGLLTNWGREYRIGYVPAVIELLNLGADGIGFTGRVPALTEPSEARFDETDPSHYELFGVRFVVAPQDHPAPPGGVVLATVGRHRLWHVPTSGYLEVVDITAPIATSGQQIDVAVSEQLRSRLPLDGKYPALALDGMPAASPTSNGSTTAGRPGVVETVDEALVDGRVSATVRADRSAAVLVKVSFHGRWRATVDGAPVRPQLVAPGYVAVPVPSGRHSVVAWYEPVSSATYASWAAVGIGALAGLALFDRRRRRAQSSVVVVDREGLERSEVVDVSEVSEVSEVSDVVEGEAVVVGEAVVAGTRDASVGSS